MKLLLAVEGPNDEHLLLPLIRRILPKRTLPLDIRTVRLSSLVTALPAGSPQHILERKATLAAIKADALGCDALVIVHDVDRGAVHATTTMNPRQAHKEVVGLLKAGATAPVPTLKVAVGAPCRMLEAWVLADLALLASLGTSVENISWFAHSPQPQPRPQDMLKTGVDLCLARSRKPADYAAVGSSADLGVLRTRSPISFAAFERELQAIA